MGVPLLFVAGMVDEAMNSGGSRAGWKDAAIAEVNLAARLRTPRWSCKGARPGMTRDAVRMEVLHEGIRDCEVRRYCRCGRRA